ncbi:MAG: DUF2975 domain-containing protein [Pseudomonadota bacterium]
MSNFQKLRQWSRLLYLVTCLGMVVVVGGMIFVAFLAPPTAETMQAEYQSINVAPQLSPGIVRAMLIVTAVAVFIWLIILDQMRRLFGCFAVGQVLSDKVAGHIRRIGWGLLGLSVWQVVMVPITSLLLTWDNPQGQHSISIAFNSDMAGFALAAGLMIVIGWAMREAAAVRAENQAFV